MAGLIRASSSPKLSTSLTVIFPHFSRHVSRSPAIVVARSGNVDASVVPEQFLIFSNNPITINEQLDRTTEANLLPVNVVAFEFLVHHLAPMLWVYRFD